MLFRSASPRPPALPRGPPAAPSGPGPAAATAPSDFAAMLAEQEAGSDFRAAEGGGVRSGEDPVQAAPASSSSSSSSSSSLILQLFIPLGAAPALPPPRLWLDGGRPPGNEEGEGWGEHPRSPSPSFLRGVGLQPHAFCLSAPLPTPLPSFLFSSPVLSPSFPLHLLCLPLVVWV